MYNPASHIATEFIDHNKIEYTLSWARVNAANKDLMRQVLAKARQYRGLTHSEAALLLECTDEEINAEVRALAMEIKQRFYGNRIVMFAPLYLSNYCINSCVYCPYHIHNRSIPRRKLSQLQIEREVRALQDMGHKRLALELGEDPVHNPIDYVLESIKTIYGLRHRNGAIRRVNVNIAATTVENYRKLRDAGIGTYILFQETYHKGNYENLHPRGPKSNYAWHTEAMDRAMEAGLDDVGLGVLYGLHTYKYDFVGLLMHAEHLVERFGVGPHTVSVPRICAADGIDPANFPDAVSDELFYKIIAVLRIALPLTGMIISTRESAAVRARALELGVTQLSGGSRTTVGGYSEEGADKAADTSQFDTSDNRTLEEIVAWLLSLGHVPSFCTACYREGRTGDRFMSLVKNGQIANCCGPNALMTLAEYIHDYATPKTRNLGAKVIERQFYSIANPRTRQMTANYLQRIADGERDFRI